MTPSHTGTFPTVNLSKKPNIQVVSFFGQPDTLSVGLDLVPEIQIESFPGKATDS